MSRTITYEASSIQKAVWNLSNLSDQQRQAVISAALDERGGQIDYKVWYDETGRGKYYALDGREYANASVTHEGNGRFRVTLSGDVLQVDPRSLPGGDQSGAGSGLKQSDATETTGPTNSGRLTNSDVPSDDVGINVVVRDTNGNPVSGAKVSVDHPRRPGFSESGQTDQDGLFTAKINGANPNSNIALDVTVSKDGVEFETDAWMYNRHVGQTTKIPIGSGKAKTVRFTPKEPLGSGSQSGSDTTSGDAVKPQGNEDYDVSIPESPVQVGPDTPSRSNQEIIEDRQESTGSPGGSDSSGSADVLAVDRRIKLFLAGLGILLVLGVAQ